MEKREEHKISPLTREDPNTSLVSSANSWLKNNAWFAMTMVLVIFIIVFMTMMYTPTPLNSGFVPRSDDQTAWTNWMFWWITRSEPPRYA